MSPDDDRSTALRLVPVSRETIERLDAYVALLSRWRPVVNLVAEESFGRLWVRHIADSAQLLALAPGARNWVDLGSGAGFPGMVIAIQLADSLNSCVHLVESDQRKSAFLREAARTTGAKAIVHNIRAETASENILGPVDAVTARALAPLSRLISFATLWLNKGAIGVFPRGRAGEAEITDLQKTYEYHFSLAESITDPDARIAVVRSKAAGEGPSRALGDVRG